jgi:hypothetical protein
MLEINMKDKQFIKIEDTSMKTQKILERTDLQEYIINSWELFTNEIGMPDIYYMGKEINPHGSVKDRIDILAIDQNESKIIIFELKRDKEKTQLIQSISYAGMINTWTSEDILLYLEENHGSKELKEFFSNNAIDFDIRIILLAESYEPEVILAADWLKSIYGVDINAYTIQLLKLDNKILLDIEQKYPLKELSDAYEARKKRQIQNENQKKITWEDVKIKIKNDFVKEAVDYLCKNVSQGDPNRNRFVTTLSQDGIKDIIFNINKDCINIYSWVKNKEECKDILYNIFDEKLKIKEWRDGLSFYIYNKEDFNKLLAWLKISDQALD